MRQRVKGQTIWPQLYVLPCLQLTTGNTHLERLLCGDRERLRRRSRSRDLERSRSLRRLSRSREVERDRRLSANHNTE